MNANSSCKVSSKLRPKKSSKLRKLVLTLMPLSLLLVLPACKTIPSIATITAPTHKGTSAAVKRAEVRNVEVRCTGHKPITYSAALDTPVTTAQVRVYNDMMKRRRCKAFVR